MSGFIASWLPDFNRFYYFVHLHFNKCRCAVKHLPHKIGQPYNTTVIALEMTIFTVLRICMEEYCNYNTMAEIYFLQF